MVIFILECFFLLARFTTGVIFVKIGLLSSVSVWRRVGDENSKGRGVYDFGRQSLRPSHVTYRKHYYLINMDQAVAYL